MPLSVMPVHRTILVVDIAGFTDPAKGDKQHLAIRGGLYDVLGRALAETGIDMDACIVEDRGDGALILIPSHVPKARVAGPFPQRLVAGLRQYNAAHSDDASMQLRVGLHFGEVRTDQNGPVGTAINFAFRILDASAAKAELRKSDGVVAFIASDHFYREVIAPDPAADPGAYQRIPVAVKGVSTEAWLHLPSGGRASTQVTRPDSYENLLEWLPADEADLLSDLLAGVSVANLPTLVRRAGPAIPIPPGGDAWDAFRWLMDFNAGPDGLPPALLFLDLLADQLDGELRESLTKWIWSLVRRFRLEPALRAHRLNRAPLPAQSRLHLVIAVEPDGIDPEHCLFSHWRQDDPDEWPPARAEMREVRLSELEYHVDEVLQQAEQAWGEQRATAAIEFVLPRALLGLPVHRWRAEHRSGDPRPISFDYPVVVRSLERMRSPRWHRAWRQRWRSLVDDPSPARVHFGQPGEYEGQHLFEELVANPRWVSMVLTEAPSPKPTNGADELTAALRAGIPVMMWHPRASADSLHEFVNRLSARTGLADLPAHTRDSRRAALSLSSPPSDVNLAKDLVLLWDDPRRTVVLGQSTISPRW